jgi:hypothetical protein
MGPVLVGDLAGAALIADGFCAKELVPHGRDAQSMAFFRAPGMDQNREWAT